MKSRLLIEGLRQYVGKASDCQTQILVGPAFFACDPGHA